MLLANVGTNATNRSSDAGAPVTTEPPTVAVIELVAAGYVPGDAPAGI